MVKKVKLKRECTLSNVFWNRKPIKVIERARDEVWGIGKIEVKKGRQKIKVI